MTKGKTGRPTKYSKELLKKAQTYYDQCANSEEMPFIEKLSMILDVNDDTINEWVKGDVDEEFTATVKKIKQLQKLRLQELGLKGGRQQIFSIFLLKTNHGFVETSKQINEGETTNIIVADVGYSPTRARQDKEAKKVAESPVYTSLPEVEEPS